MENNQMKHDVKIIFFIVTLGFFGRISIVIFCVVSGRTIHINTQNLIDAIFFRYITRLELNFKVTKQPISQYPIRFIIIAYDSMELQLSCSCAIRTPFTSMN